MRYLISGHPRTRTAWLCALLNAHHSLCYHDAISYRIDLGVDAGFADPGVACMAPLQALRMSKGKPRICIRRDDWQISLQAWLNMEIPKEAVTQWNENCQLWYRGSTCIGYDELEDNDVVKEIIQICTHEPASMTLIQIFQGLKIEQHLEKAQSAFKALQLASTP